MDLLVIVSYFATEVSAWPGVVLFCVDRDHLEFNRNWLVAVPEHRDRGLHSGLDDIAHTVPVLDRQRRQLA